MPKEFPEQRDPVTGRTGRFADEGELVSADEPVLDSATIEARPDVADRDPASSYDDDAVAIDIATQPLSEITDVVDGSGDEETADGLDALEETVREQAEDRAPGGRDDFLP